MEEQIERAEQLVLKKKTELDEVVRELKLAREKAEKEKQEKLLDAVAKSKWNYDKIMELIQGDPEEMED